MKEYRFNFEWHGLNRIVVGLRRLELMDFEELFGDIVLLDVDL